MFDRPLIAGYSLTFTSIWLWLIVLVFLGAIALTCFYYRRTNPMLNRSFRILLGTLRGLAFAAIFFVFAEPLLIISRSDDKVPTVAIVVDNSSSMAQNRHSGEQFKNMAQYVREVESKIAPGTRVVHYTLSDTIIQDGEIKGTFPVTAIGDGLSYLSDAYDGENLQSVILLSDGVSDFGSNPATVAKKLGAPITTIGFGNPNPLPDIRIAEVNCNPVGFAGKEFPVEVVIESRGFENLRMPIRLRNGEKVLTQKEIDLVGDGKQQSVQLLFTPAAEGELVLEVSAPVQQNEESDKNNTKQVQVKIRKSRIKILLASAYLNWEYKFLNRALASKQDFEVSSQIDAKQRLAGTIPFPENIDALNEYDAVILNDFDADWFDRRKQLWDAFFDRSGKGMFVLAGENFAGKPRAGFVTLLLPYGFAEGRQIVIPQPASFTLTERGRIHPLMRLAEDAGQTQRILNTLPPFSGYLLTSALAKDALVIAAAPALFKNEPDTPIMATHRYRNGKVAVLSAFPFWKLDFLSKGVNENDSTMVSLMENMVLWLVARDDIERVAIIPDKPIFIAGETVRLNARVFDESYIAIDDAELTARLISNQSPKDSSVVSFQLVKPGTYAATLHYLPSGTYAVNGVVRREGQQIGTPSASFIVEPYSLEDLSHISDFDLLKRISSLSGGQFYAADDTASIPPFPKFKEKALVKRSELALFDYPALLVIILASLCVEWYLRKRHQLL
jgi:hypothetical protein